MKNLSLLLVFSLFSVGAYAQWQINGSDIYYDQGNVGIGLTNPGNKLEIAGLEDYANNNRTFIQLTNNSVSQNSLVSMRLFAGVNGSFTSLTHLSETYLASPGQVDFGQLRSTGAGLILSASNGIIKLVTGSDGEIEERMIIDNEGNIGIGTSSPNSSLEVVGNNTDLDGDITDCILTIKNNNYSRYSTEAYSDTWFRNAQIQGIRGRGTILDPQDLLPFDRVFGIYGYMYANGSLNETPIASIEYFVGDTISSGDITFSTLAYSQSIREERMRITNVGKVGIGTSTPTSRLQIAEGDVFISDIEKGVIMKSPDGQCWKGTVDNEGSLNFVQIDCPGLITQTNFPQDASLDKVSVFPNPTEDFISINFDEKEFKKLKYTILDLNGRLMMKGTARSSNDKINISYLSDGIYFISLTDKSGNRLISEKIIKN